MSEAVLKSFIYNNKVYDISNFDSIYKESSPSIYEVIRVIDKVPIFLEDHYERLKNSAKLLGYDITELNITLTHVEANIKKMIDINNIKDYNIKLILNNLNENINEYYFFIKSTYPDINMYEKGVNTCLYNAIRENPNAKIINMNLRNKINDFLKSNNYYEAILINEENEITEGSRSNIFFIKNNILYTAPLSKVLPGITRQKIINICNENNINVIEASIYAKDIKNFDSAFISGTSPKVLPIAKIDDINFNVKNPLLIKIMNLYDEEIKNYILQKSF